MIGSAFTFIIKWCAFSCLLLVLGSVVTYYLHDSRAAIKLCISYILNFNGIFIIGVAYGLLEFIYRKGGKAYDSLINCLQISDEIKLKLIKDMKWYKSKTVNILISIVTTIMGAVIMVNCKYPYNGFPKYFLMITSISVCSVAGLMGGYFITCVRFFHTLDQNCSLVKTNYSNSNRELEAINQSFLVSITMGIIALYLSFRGTITADFQLDADNQIFESLLVYPVVLFLPGLLFVSFYYRYVLRKIQQEAIEREINNIENLYQNQIFEIREIKEKLELEKLIGEVKQRLKDETNKISLFSLKDSPAVFFFVILILQIILQNDTTMVEYFTNFGRLSK